MALTYALRRSRKMPRRKTEDFMPRKPKPKQSPEEIFRAVSAWQKILA